jgi:hypothetical protein
VQSLGLCFYPHLKCLKRFIVLLPGAAVRIAEDLRKRADLSLSYDAIASRREYGLALDLCDALASYVQTAKGEARRNQQDTRSHR